MFCKSPFRVAHLRPPQLTSRDAHQYALRILRNLGVFLIVEFPETTGSEKKYWIGGNCLRMDNEDRIRMKKKITISVVPLIALALAGLGISSAVATTGTTVYKANLHAVNHATGHGTLTLRLKGNVAIITEKVSGLAATFGGKPYPHVQHIHGLAMGTCPTASADMNGDGVVSTTEGAPSYGAIQTTLSVFGSTSPAAGTNLKIATSGENFYYTRTIKLSSKALMAVRGGTAVIVVHGLDPATLSTKAQGEKSDLVPSLPLAATSPALCGVLVRK